MPANTRGRARRKRATGLSEGPVNSASSRAKTPPQKPPTMPMIGAASHAEAEAWPCKAPK